MDERTEKKLEIASRIMSGVFNADEDTAEDAWIAAEALMSLAEHEAEQREKDPQDAGQSFTSGAVSTVSIHKSSDACDPEFWIKETVTGEGRDAVDDLGIGTPEYVKHFGCSAELVPCNQFQPPYVFGLWYAADRSETAPVRTIILIGKEKTPCTVIP